MIFIHISTNLSGKKIARWRSDCIAYIVTLCNSRQDTRDIHKVSQ